MRIFFYTGRRDINISGMSSKVWKIGLKGRTLTLQWGATDLKNRRVVPKYLQTKTRVYSSVNAAKESMQQRIRTKLSKGYEVKPRRRR